MLNNDSVLTDILGTAINPQGPNATTDEPTVIIVTTVVYDAIVLNIPDTLNISLIDRIEALCTHDFVILHHYDTNTPNETQRTNRFHRPTNFNYTYLGLRDISSTGSVVQIFMYYEVCSRKAEGLAIYPEVPHPENLPEASTRTTRLASCVEYLHNTTSLLKGQCMVVKPYY